MEHGQGAFQSQRWNLRFPSCLAWCLGTFDGLLIFPAVGKTKRGGSWPPPMFFSELLAVSCRLSGLRRPDAAFLFIRAARTHLERAYRKLTGLGAQEIPKRLLKKCLSPSFRAQRVIPLAARVK